MNILIDKLPDKANGKNINPNFRRMILFEIMAQDDTLPDELKIKLALDYLYLEPVESLKKGIDGLLWFYNCGEEVKAGGSGTGKRAYDFEQDAPYIYAAFLSVYGIDLDTVQSLHWWKFQALFRSLPEDCKINKIMGYRLADTSKMKGKERDFYNKMKALYRIKETTSTERISTAAKEHEYLESVNKRFAAAQAWINGGNRK